MIRPVEVSDDRLLTSIAIKPVADMPLGLIALDRHPAN
jgi:hypothetical protein